MYGGFGWCATPSGFLAESFVQWYGAVGQGERPEDGGDGVIDGVLIALLE